MRLCFLLRIPIIHFKIITYKLLYLYDFLNKLNRVNISNGK